MMLRRDSLRLLALAAALSTALPALLACGGGGGRRDGGPDDGGAECVVDEDCDISDGDPCTDSVCLLGECELVRQEPKMVLEVTIATTGPAASVDLSGSQVVVAEGAAGVGDYRLNETSIEERRRLPTAFPAETARIWDGSVIVTEGRAGIEVFPAGATTPSSAYEAADRVLGISWVDNLVLAYAFSEGVEIIDYADPANPTFFARAETHGRAYGAVGWGESVLVADGLAGITAFDWTDRANPAVAEDAFMATEGRVVAVARRSRILAMAETGAGGGLVDLEASDGPTRFASMELGGDVVAVNLLSTNTAIFAAREGGLVLVDLMDRSAPYIWIQEATAGPALALDRDGERIAVAMGTAGVAIYDLACTPPDPSG